MEGGRTAEQVGLDSRDRDPLRDHRREAAGEVGVGVEPVPWLLRSRADQLLVADAGKIQQHAILRHVSVLMRHGGGHFANRAACLYVADGNASILREIQISWTAAGNAALEIRCGEVQD